MTFQILVKAPDLGEKQHVQVAACPKRDGLLQAIDRERPLAARPPPALILHSHLIFIMPYSRRIPEAAWEGQREFVLSKYLGDNLSLKEVRDELALRRGFEVT